MPNHVINEVIFSALGADAKNEIMANTVNPKGEIDFAILLPKPLNVWDSSCSSLHEKTFGTTGLDWARTNWGTKWNAYGHNQGGKYRSLIDTDQLLILTFQTAWRPPYGWLVAILNRFHVSFDHNWLSEGGGDGVRGKFDYPHYEDGGGQGQGWLEESADEELHRHLHKLLWGVEEFADEAAS